MHLRGTPQTMGWSEKVGAAQLNVIDEIRLYFGERIEATERAGIARDRLCLDAGFGFGKSLEENLEIVRRGREIASLSVPTLSATSRKSSIGKLLGDAPVEDRLFGTAAMTTLAIANGAAIVRVHDVKEMSQVARVADAVVRTL
jgi:dihydropteroate synthase